jgi:hypothetical protein
MRPGWRVICAALTALVVASMVGGCAPGQGASGAQPAWSAEVPPAPAGMGRVWLLRQFEPGESLLTPGIYIDGRRLAFSQPGTAFYRDLAPGRYTFTVDTCTVDFGQAATVEVEPRSEIDLEIQSLISYTWFDCLPPRTFYVRRVDPARARLFLGQLAYLGAR